MIVRFTEGKDRWRLGFTEMVVREFGFVEAEYGFSRTKENTTCVRYESERLFLNIFHGRGSYEIGVELGELSEPDWYFGLPTLIEALAPEYEGRTAFQASNRKAVAYCVTESARLLRVYCSAPLAGDADALRLIRQTGKAQAKRDTLWATFGAIISKADQAWERKDLDEARILYQQGEPGLNETRRRRLRYLLKKEEEPT